MAEKVQKGDFIRLQYTGKTSEGIVFDTTYEKVAKDNDLYSPQRSFEAAEVCIGEGQLLPGLDAALPDKEIGREFNVSIPPETAFGKRDVKNVKIVPLSTFREHKVEPQPGLQVNVDGEVGIVKSIAGGRVIVNFNHPLAGKTVEYTVTIVDKITDAAAQILSFLHVVLRIPKNNLVITVSEKKAVVQFPMALPAEFTTAMGEKLKQLTKLEKVEFTVKEQEGKA